MAGIVTKNRTTSFYRKIPIIDSIVGMICSWALVGLIAICCAPKVDVEFCALLMGVVLFTLQALFGLSLLALFINAVWMRNRPILILDRDGVMVATGFFMNNLVHLAWEDVRFIKVNIRDTEDGCWFDISFHIRDKSYTIPFHDFRSKQDDVLYAIRGYRSITIDTNVARELKEKKKYCRCNVSYIYRRGISSRRHSCTWNFLRHKLKKHFKISGN